MKRANHFSFLYSRRMFSSIFAFHSAWIQSRVFRTARYPSIPSATEIEFLPEFVLFVNLPFPVPLDQGPFDLGHFFTLEVEERPGPVQKAVDGLRAVLLPLHLRVDQGPQLLVFVLKPERKAQGPFPKFQVIVRDLDESQAVLFDGILESFVLLGLGRKIGGFQGIDDVADRTFEFEGRDSLFAEFPDLPQLVDA